MAGGDYGRIRHTFWTDPDIKRVLTAEQKALLLYFFTSPHGNMIGLYHCPLEYAAAEVGLSVSDVAEWVRGPLAQFLSYDALTEEVLVHRFARHQIAEVLQPKDNRMKRVVAELASVHSAELVRKFLELYADWDIPFEAPAPPPDRSSKGASKALKQAPSKPLRSHSIAEHSIAEEGSSSSLRSEAEAPPRRFPAPVSNNGTPPSSPSFDSTEAARIMAQFRAEAVTIILDELWMSTREKPPARYGRDWSLARELDIWNGLVEHDPPEDVNGAMRVMRRVGGFQPLEGLSLLLFQSREPQCRDLYQRCLQFHRKQAAHEAGPNVPFLRVSVGHG